MKENGFTNMKLNFDVAVAFSDEEHKMILSDYKLSKHPNNLSINITKQELDDYTEEEQEN